MSERRKTLRDHESIIIERFVEWYNEKHDQDYFVHKRLDPPDAVIINNKDEKSFIEFTDVWYSGAYARDHYSYASKDEEHVPMKGPFVNMDDTFSRRFAKQVKNKKEKKSYSDAYDKYGPGMLLLYLQYPWLNELTFRFMEERLEETEINDTGYFSTMYIGWPSRGESAFSEWDNFNL